MLKVIVSICVSRTRLYLSLLTEPVCGAEGTLNNTEEGKHHPVLFSRG